MSLGRSRPKDAKAGGRTHGRPAVRPAGDTDTGGGGRTAPVILMSYSQAGMWRLRNLLSDRSDLAFTQGTGLLPLCEQTLATWRHVEGRRPQAPPSAMAVASVRSLLKGMITALVLKTGRSRWCEVAVAQQGSAEAFLQVFPKARFVCLHRSCPDVIYSILQANHPWGLSGPAFASFVTAHPDSAVSALAAYWVAHAGPLLAFEEAHPESCLRVRYEDLATVPDQVERDLREFLGPDEGVASLPSLPGGDELPDFTGPMAPGCGKGIPADQLPPALLAQVNDLQGKLGHPPLDRPSD